MIGIHVQTKIISMCSEYIPQHSQCTLRYSHTFLLWLSAVHMCGHHMNSFCWSPVTTMVGSRLHAWFTCYHAWDDEWEYNHLQHPHQELSREAKVLLVEMGKRCKLSDQDAQSDSWKIRSLIEPFGNKTNLQTVDVWKNSCRKTSLNSDVFITSIF